MDAASQNPQGAKRSIMTNTDMSTPGCPVSAIPQLQRNSKPGVAPAVAGRNMTAFSTNNPTVHPSAVSELSLTCSQAIPDPSSLADHEEGKAGPAQSFLPSPLFDPGRRPRVDWSGRPSSRPLQGAAARSGGQGRRRLAPGPEPRAATRSRPLAASMASMARTHPLPAASTGAPAQTSPT